MATTRIHHDLKIEVPLEEELLAAVECALEHFERKAKHSPEAPTAAENKVVKKLRRALLEVNLAGRSVRRRRQRIGSNPATPSDGSGGNGRGGVRHV